MVERQPGVRTTGRAPRHAVPGAQPLAHRGDAARNPGARWPRCRSSCPPAKILADQSLEEIWTCAPQEGTETITLTLASAVRVTGVRMTQGRPVEFPATAADRDLARRQQRGRRRGGATRAGVHSRRARGAHVPVVELAIEPAGGAGSSACARWAMTPWRPGRLREVEVLTECPAPVVEIAGGFALYSSRHAARQADRACTQLALDAVLTAAGGHCRARAGRTRRTAGSPPSAGSPRRQPSSRRFPTGGPAAARRAAATRHRAALHPPGGGHRPRLGGPQRGRHHADRVGQDALLQRAGAERHPARPVRARAVSVSDQGARAGSAGRAARAVGPAVAARRARDRRLHLRRRHAAGCAPRDPRPRARRAQQPRHDPLGHPAAPSALGEAVREPALRRHRRAARLSRRVRQPPDERAAAAAADLPALRLEPDVHLLVGDDRQSARAGRGARRAAVRAGVREAARRAARSSSSSSTRRSSTSSSASGGRIWRRRAASRRSS